MTDAAAPMENVTPRKAVRKRRVVGRVVLTIEPESLGGEAIDTAATMPQP